MSRSLRRGKIALVALVAVLGAVTAYVFWAARTTLRDAMLEPERWSARELSTARSRPPLLQPYHDGDAWPVYRELLASDPQDDAARRRRMVQVLEAAHRGLHVPAGSPLDPLPAGFTRWPEKGPPRNAPRLRFALVEEGEAHLAASRNSDALLWAIAALVVNHDAQSFGGDVTPWFLPNDWEGSLELIARALAAGPCDTATLNTLAELLDALGTRSPPVRGVIARLLVATRDVADEDAQPMAIEDNARGDRVPISRQARWLWSRNIARASTVRFLQAETQSLVAAWNGPADRLADAAREATGRWQSQDNPYLGALETGLYVKPDRLLLCVRLRHECVAVVRAAIAVALYTNEHGELPRTLDDLAPAYFRSVPLDPVTRRPVRYSAGRVWASGPDEDDDGGRPLRDRQSPTWTVGYRGDPPDGDVVCVVFDPGSAASAPRR